MSVSRLSLANFRSYSDALIAPGAGLVVLTGDNGAGKTNVLEALSLLSPGRGLRGASLPEMARRNGLGGFAVAARLSSPLPRAGGDQGVGFYELRNEGEGPTPNPSRLREGSVDIGTGTTAEAPERRQVRINGATASAMSLSEWLSVLWLTPAMDRLFTEAASGRRRFFDRLVLALQPSHASHAARYEAAMRARNKLLAEPAPDPAWLGALETAMAEHGARIAEARERTLAALTERLLSQPDGPFARADLAFDRWRPADGNAEPALLDALRSGRSRDAAAGRTLAGPHRTDLLVTHVAKGENAASCSTGEQKALLLSIVLAHAELVADRTERPPILLLDEVAAHLDRQRRTALFERLGAWGGQVWMTGTERALFEGAGGDVTWLHVADGTVTPE